MRKQMQGDIFIRGDILTEDFITQFSFILLCLK